MQVVYDDLLGAYARPYADGSPGPPLRPGVPAPPPNTLASCAAGLECPIFQTAFTLVENVNRAIEWVNHVNTGRPYFLHLSLNVPHTDIKPPVYNLM